MVETIVEAGFVTLTKHGLQGTTTRHIADVAGISVGTLYQYFADKDAVYVAMRRHVVGDLERFLRTLTPELVRKSIPDAISILLYGFRDWVQKNDGRYLVYARNAVQLGLDHEMDRLEQALMDVVVQYLMQNPTFTRIENIPGMMYVLINGGVFAMIRFLSTPEPRITFEQFVDAVASLIGGERLPGKDRRRRYETADAASARSASASRVRTKRAAPSRARRASGTK